jgi:hypothetical protein
MKIGNSKFFLLLLISAACGPIKPPPIDPPKPRRTVQATIRNAALPAGTLATDDGRRVECPITR